MTSFSPARIATFVRAHLLWVLLGPVVMVFGTAVHEAAHAAVAWLSGATRVELTVIPQRSADGAFRFGLTEYWGLDGRNELLVGLAPSILAACLSTFAYVWLPQLPKNAWGKLGYVVGLLLPLVDLSIALAGGLRAHPYADLYPLSGTPGWLLLISLFLGAQVWFSYRPFVTLFGEQLSRVEHALLTTALLMVPQVRWLLATTPQ